MKKLKKFFPQFKKMHIYRIKEWWYYIGFVLLGFLAGGKDDIFHLFLTIVSVFFMGCFAFSLNEVFDRKLQDRAIIFPLIPGIAIIISLFFLNPLQRIFLLLLLILATLYSLPLFYLKKKPFLGTLINAGGFPLLILMGAEKLKEEALVLYFIFFFLSFLAQLIHEYSHQEKDRKEKILTTAIKIGEKGKKYLWLLLLPPIFISLRISYICAFFIFLMLITLLLKRNKDFSILRKIYRYENMIFGLYLLIYFLRK